MTSYDTIRDIEFKLHSAIVRLRYIATSMEITELRGLSDLEAMVIGHRFRVAVVGEFNRGKSTAINALLGATVLPASIEACSAALNRVTYGPHITARVVMHGAGPAEARSEMVPLDQLVDYVTKLSPDSTRMASAVEEAIITYPSPFCRNNVDLIDTPGLNDELTMTVVTEGAIRRVHAAIVVIRAIISFSHSEKLLLEKLLAENVTNLLFIVTAIDELELNDRPRTLREVQKRIAKAIEQYADEVFEQGTEEYEEFLLRIGKPQVYGVSAIAALEAKVHADPQREHDSGFPEFEAALERMLADKHGAASAIQIARKLIKECDLMFHQIGGQRRAHEERRIKLAEAETHFVREAEHTRSEIVTHLHLLHQDVDNLCFEVQHRLENVSDVLLGSIDQVLHDLTISGNEVITFAAGLLHDPRYQGLVNPAQHRWMLASASPHVTPGLQSLYGLRNTLIAAVHDAWQDLIYGVVRHVYREFEQLVHNTATGIAKAHSQYAQAASGLCTLPETTTVVSAIEQQLRNTLQQLNDQRRAIVERLTSDQTPILRLLPSVLAVRSVVRVLDHPVHNALQDRFVTEFKEGCLRAITSDVDGQMNQLKAYGEPLLEHIRVGATQLLCPLAEFGSANLSLEKDVREQLRQVRANEDDTGNMDNRRLTQYEGEIMAIREATQQVIKQLDDTPYERGGT